MGFVFGLIAPLGVLFGVPFGPGVLIWGRKFTVAQSGCQEAFGSPPRLQIRIGGLGSRAAKSAKSSGKWPAHPSIKSVYKSAVHLSSWTSGLGGLASVMLPSGGRGGCRGSGDSPVAVSGDVLLIRCLCAVASRTHMQIQGILRVFLFLLCRGPVSCLRVVVHWIEPCFAPHVGIRCVAA